MPEKAQEMWLCSVCSLKEFKYGANCPQFEDRTCENLATPNAAGRWYLQDELNALNRLKSDIKGIGISEIANEDNSNTSTRS